jgi:SpoVK/Ycf46/Vps4 family AAA+-type ATPase
MAATWLAEHLGLGLVTLNLASVVSSLLGSTGRNLRAALDEAAGSPIVLLIDEFDALAKRRDDLTDVGELKRIVNVLLLELDRWPSSSLLVAATNHRQLLDVAIERRFDRIIELTLPDDGDRERIVLSLMGPSGEDDPRIRGVVAGTSGWTGSDLRRLYSTAARRSALNGTDLEDQLLIEVLDRLTPGELRDTVWLQLSDGAGLTNRQLAHLSGVSHPTVGAGIKRARGDS